MKEDFDYINSATGVELPKVTIYGSVDREFIIGIFSIDRAYHIPIKKILLERVKQRSTEERLYVL